MSKKTFFLILLIIFQPLISNEKLVRGANSYGFFADFLWAINHIQYCIEANLTPVIYWGTASSYYCPEGLNGAKDNAWEYYFEPVSSERYIPGDRIYVPNYYPSVVNFTALSWYCQYIDSKKSLPAGEQKSFKPIDDHEEIYLSSKYDGQRRSAYPTCSYHLYSFTLRGYVKTQIIDRFIKIKPSILEKIRLFYDQNIRGKKTVGIHLRGGHIYNEVLPVPLEYIFNEANTYADLGYQFFIATDQYPLIEAAQKNLRGTVISYPCERFEKTTSPDGTSKLHPQLGEDLLVEACLLSMTDHFIHTLSNVSTAVLFFNPNLTHTVIY